MYTVKFPPETIVLWLMYDLGEAFPLNSILFYVFMLWTVVDQLDFKFSTNLKRQGCAIYYRRTENVIAIHQIYSIKSKGRKRSFLITLMILNNRFYLLTSKTTTLSISSLLIRVSNSRFPLLNVYFTGTCPFNRNARFTFFNGNELSVTEVSLLSNMWK